MNNINTIYRVGLTLLAIALIGLLTYWVSLQIPLTFSSAPSGLPAQNLPATSTVLTLSADTATTLFEARRSCNARSISTGAQNLKISFSSTTPNSFIGSVQLSSTTVAYDSGLYGCGQWRGFATASTTIDLNEF